MGLSLKEIAQLTALLLALVFLGSCDQKTETIYNFGSKATVEDVLSALLDAASTSNYDSGQPGDWVALEKTQKVPGGTPSVVGYDDYSVLSRDETDESLTIRFRKEIFDENREKIANTAFDVVLSKNAVAALANPLAVMSVQETTTSFYNVRRYQDTLGAPREIAQTAQCGGIPNCEMPSEVVQFDMVTETEGEDPMIVNYTIHFARVIPGYWATEVLGLVLSKPGFPGHAKACLNTIIKNNGKDQPVELCETIVDFLPLP